ncbi:hypothetical protein [Chamaesiphon polymorphus]|uniref:Uncharacterized protein n=1 Tax=Chamaesiphon polymorphus CCALA 037 TaxID=2107692 RepID=A0A2T1GNX8_9CYAN|nr:hypothetical protein [Chamaesiphon polymorphus]PSB59640.1 hypothetical protein C7B77_00150 [Chamaesiphon polymorphus CCALA 037]
MIPKRKLADVSPPPLTGNYLRLVRNPSQGTNTLGNPIYTVEVYLRGEKYQTFNAVSGTVNTQNRDRNCNWSIWRLTKEIILEPLAIASALAIGCQSQGFWRRGDTNESLNLEVHVC